MKKLLFVLVFCSAIITNVQSQIEPHDADLFLKVIDNSENVVPFLKITLKTNQGLQPQYSITDMRGNARFKVTTGSTYKVHISDTSSVGTINIPLNSMSYITQKITVPNLTAEQMSERAHIDTIDQSKLELERPDQGNIFFKVGLFDHLNQPLKNMPIRIFSSSLKMVYTAKTNYYGFAQFHVPGKTNYVIAVDKFENFDTITVPHHSFGLQLTYIPTKIRESEKNDTITQSPDPSMRTTTERALVKIHLKNHENQPLSDEMVYFNVIESKKVYAGKTGRDGVLTILLPKGQQYEMNFKYERAMKRLDYPMDPTLFTTQYYMTYIGSKKVEEFYANAKREGEFRTEFMDATATNLQLDAGVLEITSRGFNLNFPDEGAILTPAVYNDKLIVSSGFYSPNIYCFEAKTGKYIWGLTLAENGPSVLVVEDGMLLINTQSCTLYAIDIESGMLAWSKWLGPNIYHSPAVSNGKVYAAYPDDLTYSTNKFVLAAFNLKTGEIVWQNHLKNEPLSAPVVVNKQIFITDSRGYLYGFTDEKGEQIAATQANATCPPVFDGKSLLVNSITDLKKPFSYLTIYNPTTLALEKVLNNFADSSFLEYNRNFSASDLMSYSRNRVFINAGHYYQINSQGLQSFSGSDGIVAWTYPLKFDLAFNPVLTFAGKYLLASTFSTKIALIDPVKGQKIREYYISDIISSEPAIANGWIYCGTKNGKLVAINTKDKTITGWNQWGMNAGHNPFSEEK